MKSEATSQSNDQVITASFQQKSAGVSLVIIGSTAMYYIARAWPMRQIALAGTAIPDGYGGLVMTALGLVILAEIVLHIVLVIGSGSAPEPTALERTAAMKANGNAYGVFVAGVLAIIGLLFVGFPAFCMANVAMITLFFSEIVRLGSQLFYYSRTV